MTTRKQRQVNQDNNSLSVFGTTRKVKRELSEMEGCFKILWDKSEGEYIHIKEDTIKVSVLPIVSGMDDVATVGVVSVFDVFLEGTEPIPMCCLRVGLGKEELFAWLPYTEYDRRRFIDLADKVNFCLMNGKSIKHIRSLIEDETPHAEILKFGVMPEELDSFDVEDDPMALLGQVWLGDKQKEAVPQQVNTYSEKEMVSEFEDILAKLEAEKAAKKKALAEKKQAKALKDTAKVQQKKKSR